MLHCFIKFFLASAIFTFNCSVEYISLKALCHHQDKNVSEAIQKKIYGILAPLFSQKPWQGRWEEKKIIYKDYSKLQAKMYFLRVWLSHYSKDICEKILDKCEFDPHLRFIRKYQSFGSCGSFIPFLYENKVWSLKNEGGFLNRPVRHLQCQVGYLEYFKSLIGWKVENFAPKYLTLSIILGFNDVSMSMAVLKSQGKSGEDLLICLFASGCISIVDPKSFKEIWFREAYNAERDEPDSIPLYGGYQYIKFSSHGRLIGGYRNILCFRPFEQKNVLKFYTIDQVMNDKSCEYQITDVYDETIFNDNQSKYKLVSTLNSIYFFYTFYERQSKNFTLQTAPIMDAASFNDDYCYHKIKKDGSIYYCNYTDKKHTKKQVAIELNNDDFFVYFSCNDTTLIAQDNQKNIYVFNISTEPFKYTFFIPYDNKSCLNSDFWLDSDSDKILTRKGVFKIQDVFAGLPINKLENCKVENGFFKGVFLRIYWFIRSWYWAIKMLFKKYYIS